MYELDGTGSGSCSFKHQTPHLLAQSVWTYILKIAGISELIHKRYQACAAMKIRSALICPAFFLDYLTDKDGTDRFPETSLRNYHSTICKIPEESRSSVGSYKTLKYAYIHRLQQNQ